MFQNTQIYSYAYAILLILVVSDVFSNIDDQYDAINNSTKTICFRSNDALETNALSEEIKSVDGRRFYGFLTKIGWTAESGKVSFHCGGTLISDKFVLSVAHCMEYKRPMYKSQPDIVRIAERPFEGNVVGEDIKINRIFTHSSFGPLSMYDDIALIELRELSRYRPACIWTGVSLPTADLFALGHDLVHHGAQQIMSLELVNSDECDRTYSPSRKLPNGIVNSQFCAGKSNITDGEKCRVLHVYVIDPNLDNVESVHLSSERLSGYSGGPLLSQTNNNSGAEFFVIGLTNFGQRCSSRDYPNIYTKLSFYKDWIDKIINAK